MNDYATWINERTHYLTATDLVAILGLSRYATPRDIWRAKTGRSIPPTDDTAPSQAASLGNALEAPIAQWAAKHWDLGDVYLAGKHLAHHGTDPIAAATPDGYLTPSGDLIEIKTTGLIGRPAQLESWMTGIPLAIEVQVRWQMYVTDRNRCHVAALIGGRGTHLRTVERCPYWEDELAEAAHTWWDHHVKTDIPPRVTINDTVDKPARAGETVTLKNAAALARVYASARDRRKNAEDDRKRTAIRIRAALSGADTLTDNDGRVWARIDKRGAIWVRD